MRWGMKGIFWKGRMLTVSGFGVYDILMLSRDRQMPQTL